ncbi:glycine betaine ABC transporter substrate-binding protein [Amycolatopsis jiangsuensis]|uniref:Glycine betaine/proline transport system substrate-binding protein n=1 Tax=Amycolatopsis jiangsuensis TaxID=1181879 RepID=A0A840IX70_9PSEU|nr:glycine betaine ABC transporter substrate-binding protein [Amycolatopsis jiangsuensis]MBB4685494.1 glycine betaine/proline transport system substrate-binding protein [Amycolatopsis jiangsuensis]
MRTTKRFTRILAVGAAVTALVGLTAACGGRESQSGNSQEAKSITIGYIGWDEDIALTNLYQTVLESKGYKVNAQLLDAGPIYAGLAKGDVDLYLDSWLPTTHKKYWDQYHDQLEDLGVWYDQATLNLAVPDYVQDVSSIADLKAKAGDFDGKITGIEASAGETDIVQKDVLSQYSLDGAVTLQNSSTTAMLAALDGAIKAKEPIVVTLWHPHWAYSRYQLKDLQDPKGAMGKGEQIHSVGRKGFSEDFPALTEVSKKLKMSDEDLGSLEDAIQKAQKGKEKDAAKQWADQHKQFVDAAFAGV